MREVETITATEQKDGSYIAKAKYADGGVKYAYFQSLESMDSEIAKEFPGISRG